jgi:hypothetical protein
LLKLEPVSFERHSLKLVCFQLLGKRRSRQSRFRARSAR